MMLFLPDLINLSKMDAILGDTDKFLELGDLSFDDTQRTESKQQKRFLELYKSKLIIEGDLWIYSSNWSAETENVWITKNS